MPVAGGEEEKRTNEIGRAIPLPASCDIALLLAQRGAPDFVAVTPPDHGRIETRRIWCGTALNDSLDFPAVGQVFLVERDVITKKTGQQTHEIALGLRAVRRGRRRRDGC